MTTYIQGIPFDSNGKYIDQCCLDFMKYSDQQQLMQSMRDHIAMEIRIRGNVPKIKQIQCMFGGMYREGTLILTWQNAEEGFHYRFELPELHFKMSNGIQYKMTFMDEWFAR